MLPDTDWTKPVRGNWMHSKRCPWPDNNCECGGVFTPALTRHVYEALQQLKHGETIGRRQTPVISLWPMRQKWEKWGDAWETLGTDGDIVHENNKPVVPAILQLAYFRNGDSVFQLAYVIYPEESDPRKIQNAKTNYDKARCSMPIRINAD